MVFRDYNAELSDLLINQSCEKSFDLLRRESMGCVQWVAVYEVKNCGHSYQNLTDQPTESEY